MSNFVDNCRKANDSWYLPSSDLLEYDLMEILKKTLHEPSVLKQVSREEYATVGRTYTLLLEMVGKKQEVVLLHSLSRLGYYFTSKAIEIYGLSDSYLDRILILNIGARTFYRTVASATGQNVYGSYINFNDLMNLPVPVKYIVLMEYCDHLKIYKEKNVSQDYLNRKNALDSFVYDGLFNSICTKEKIITKGKEIHQKVLVYVENEIFNKGVVLFSD